MSIPRRGDLPAGGTPSTQWNEFDEIFDSTDDLIFIFKLKKSLEPISENIKTK